MLGGLCQDLRDSFKKKLDMVTVQGASEDFLTSIQPDELMIYEQW